MSVRVSVHPIPSIVIRAYSKQIININVCNFSCFFHGVNVVFLVQLIQVCYTCTDIDINWYQMIKIGRE